MTHTPEHPPRVVATRLFRAADGRTVIATIYEPVMARPDEWKCDFRISGLSEDVKSYAQGVDSMQALAMAIQGLRVHLEAVDATLTWFDGEPGDSGIPCQMPNGYGRAVERHLQDVVNEEVAKLVAAKMESKGGRSPSGGE